MKNFILFIIFLTFPVFASAKTLIVSTPLSVTSSTEITSGIDTKIESGGSFAISAGQTLTISGDFSASDYQVFSGDGTVSGLKYSKPDWWTTNSVPGTTSMTSAVQSAVTASDQVHFSNAQYLVGQVNLPDRDTYIFLNGAQITGTAGAGRIFYATYRGKLTEIAGPGQFDGPKTAYFRDAGIVETPYMGTTQYVEYKIHDLYFLVDSGVVALDFFGAREGFITDNHFKGNGDSVGTGVDTEYAIGPELRGNYFEELEYATAFRTGTEGVKLLGGTWIGNAYGIYSYRLYSLQATDIMADYNDQSIYLEDTGNIVIGDSYISTRTASPAIYVKRQVGIAYDNNESSIHHSTIRCNQLGAPFSDVTTAIRIENGNFWSIDHNRIAGFRTNGLEYDDSTFVHIENNNFAPESTYGVYAIKEDAGAVTGGTIWISGNNTYSLPISAPSTDKIYNNSGYVTENSGTATVLTGQTTIAVTHGLDVTPSTQHIAVTRFSAGDYNFYVNNITATTFDIVLNTNALADIILGWKIRMAP